MTVPYSDILDVFHSSFQSQTTIPTDLEKQFFLNALGYYELELNELDYDDVSETINNDLSRPHIIALGKLMYKYYLHRERDRILKLNNIVGKDIKLTAMGQSKQEINDAYDTTCEEVENLMNKLKDGSIY